MRARLVVFPVKGRNWCFSRCNDPLASEWLSSHTPSSFKQLWRDLFSSNPNNSNSVELLADFVSHKMNKVWTGLEKAPQGTFKSKFHGLGFRLLARVKPSEVFLKSISKEVTSLDVNYPSSLNPRLVRRRLRHVALRGTIIHEKYLYGSGFLLPLTFPISVLPLPLPNIPFFWVLFRTYSHWRARQGSERLLQLVSDHSQVQNLAASNLKTTVADHKNSDLETNPMLGSTCALRPSLKLDELLCHGYENDVLSERAISDICNYFKLNMNEVSKYRDAI